MYGINDLKSTFAMTEHEIECPVKKCTTHIPRKTAANHVSNEAMFCDACQIYIHPTTFRYRSRQDNFLWTSREDDALFSEIVKFKTEGRYENENSEDALSWNVFRYFHSSKRLRELLTVFGENPGDQESDIYYWSYCNTTATAWDPLLKAREVFEHQDPSSEGRNPSGVSEPDIIIETSETIYIIEAKFTSGNRTSGDADGVARKIENTRGYLTGGGPGFFESVFSSTYADTIRAQRYELMRFWLIGSWIADQSQKKFVLVNLVREGSELRIEEDFGNHIRQDDRRRFARWTWETIPQYLKTIECSDAGRLFEYFRDKTCGFKEDKKQETAKPKMAFTNS